ncbi:hypothetical protein AAG570_011675 [Ranatra chinensis]|uniref:Uncharacterized protein n=1 Tax=Ranatra chinensis TaxID=642074 RepID=A0ABD0YGP8_9HEMI
MFGKENLLVVDVAVKKYFKPPIAYVFWRNINSHGKRKVSDASNIGSEVSETITFTTPEDSAPSRNDRGRLRLFRLEQHSNLLSLSMLTTRFFPTDQHEDWTWDDRVNDWGSPSGVLKMDGKLNVSISSNYNPGCTLIHLQSLKAEVGTMEQETTEVAGPSEWAGKAVLPHHLRVRGNNTPDANTCTLAHLYCKFFPELPLTSSHFRLLRSRRGSQPVGTTLGHTFTSPPHLKISGAT